MEELMLMIQKDPKLWDLIEKCKQEDEELENFLTNLAEMFAVEFRALDSTDLEDKLDAFFGGLPRESLVLVTPILHIALEMYLRGKASSRGA
tara:strand:+ start:182 stop:457 length:276 start_codon:yes stop_codon:yes gene_type:complete